MWNYRKKFLLYAGLANYLNTVKISNPLSKIKTKNTLIFKLKSKGRAPENYSWTEG